MAFRHEPGDAALGGSLDRSHGADMESELARVDAPIAEATANVFGQKRKLVRPHARRRAEDEDAVPQGNGARSLGDAGADGVAPQRRGKRWVRPRKAVLAGAIEDGFERFRGEEAFPGRSAHAARRIHVFALAEQAHASIRRDRIEDGPATIGFTQMQKAVGHP